MSRQDPVLDSVSVDSATNMRAFDVLTGNVDRHPGNVIVSDGKAYAIDNGFAFSHDNSVTEFVKTPFGLNKLKSDITPHFKGGLDRLFKNKKSVDGRLADLLNNDERDAFWSRADALRKGKVSMTAPPSGDLFKRDSASDQDRRFQIDDGVADRIAKRVKDCVTQAFAEAAELSACLNATDEETVNERMRFKVDAAIVKHGKHNQKSHGRGKGGKGRSRLGGGGGGGDGDDKGNGSAGGSSGMSPKDERNLRRKIDRMKIPAVARSLESGGYEFVGGCSQRSKTASLLPSTK